MRDIKSIDPPISKLSYSEIISERLSILPNIIKKFIYFFTVKIIK